jgi:ADP-ribosylglycohydrolase
MSREAALNSLEGLALGDAFGELFFGSTARTFEELEPGPWRWTDDTHMALSIVEVLERFGAIDQDALAQAFARRYAEEPFRGYAGGAARLLRQLGSGGDWRELAPALFGTGSYGNGSAMRAAPIGAWFEGDAARAAHESALSAQVTTRTRRRSRRDRRGRRGRDAASMELSAPGRSQPARSARTEPAARWPGRAPAAGRTG